MLAAKGGQWSRRLQAQERTKLGNLNSMYLLYLRAMLDETRHHRSYIHLDLRSSAVHQNLPLSSPATYVHTVPYIGNYIIHRAQPVLMNYLEYSTRRDLEPAPGVSYPGTHGPQTRHVMPSTSQPTDRAIREHLTSHISNTFLCESSSHPPTEPPSPFFPLRANVVRVRRIPQEQRGWG